MLQSKLYNQRCCKHQIIKRILYLLVAFTSISNYSFSQTSLESVIAEQQKTKLDNSYYEALKQLALSNKESAETDLLRCLDIDPKHHASMYLLGTLHQGKGDYRQALIYYLNASKLDPKNRWYLQSLADMYKAVRQFEKAAKIFELLYKLEPNQINHHYNAAAMWDMSGNASKALKIYNKIENKEGVNEKSSFSKEEVYLEKKDIKNAIKTLSKLADAFPKEIRYKGMMADLYLQNRQDNKAIKIYYDIVDQSPKSGLAHMALSQYYNMKGDDDSAILHLKLAFASDDVSSKDKMENLIPRLQRIRKSDPKASETFEDLLKILKRNETGEPNFFLISARYYQTIEKYVEARNDLEKAIQLSPNIQNAHAEIIEVDIKLKDDKKLIEHADRAISYFPHVTGFYLYNAQANYRLKNYERVVTLCKQGIETTPIDRSMNVLLYTTLGDAAYFAKQYNTSDSAFEQVLLFDIDNYYTLNNWSYFLALRGEKLSKAEEMSKRTVTRFPDNANYMDTYGYVLYKNKKYNDAVSYLKKAINGNPENGEVLEHYADGLYKNGKPEEALKYWKLAKEKGGASELIDQKINTKKTE